MDLLLGFPAPPPPPQSQPESPPKEDLLPPSPVWSDMDLDDLMLPASNILIKDEDLFELTSALEEEPATPASPSSSESDSGIESSGGSSVSTR